MTKPYEKMVQRGAALLDDKRPGWWDGGETKQIDLKILDLRDCAKCILGQVWGTKGDRNGFSRGLEELGIWSSAGYAFSGDDNSYTSLTRRWVEEIERRRSAE